VVLMGAADSLAKKILVLLAISLTFNQAPAIARYKFHTPAATKLTATAPKISPMILVITIIPVIPRA